MSTPEGQEWYDVRPAAEDRAGQLARLKGTPPGSAAQLDAVKQWLHHASLRTKKEGRARTTAVLDVYTRDGSAYMRDPWACSTWYPNLDYLCERLSIHAVVANLGYGEAHVDVHQGRIRALFAMVAARRLTLGSENQLRLTNLLLGAYWCGADFQYGQGSYRTAARDTLREILDLSTAGPEPAEAVRDLILEVLGNDPSWLSTSTQDISRLSKRAPASGVETATPVRAQLPAGGEPR